MRTAGIIVAAGTGVRFSGSQKKQFITVNGHSILAWVISAFNTADAIHDIVIVSSKEDRDTITKVIIDQYNFNKPIEIIIGGNSRQESVYNGLCALKDNIEIAVIHDAARPAISPAKINEVVAIASKSEAALLALKSSDSVFSIKENEIEDYLDRNLIWYAQTPQVFLKDKIIYAHNKAREENFKASDDAMLFKKYCGNVKVVEGEIENIKITYESDIIYLSDIFSGRSI